MKTLNWVADHILGPILAAVIVVVVCVVFFTTLGFLAGVVTGLTVRAFRAGAGW